MAQSAQQVIPPVRFRADWVNIVFIAFAHVMAVLAIVYMVMVQFSWWTLGLAAVWYSLCGFSITGGYHRLFSHRTYKTGAPLKLLHLFFGAASVQNSAIKWSYDHRNHHSYTDSDKDPYNIKRGFMWAHLGWVLFKNDRAKDDRIVKDLLDDPLVRFQHRFYLPLAFLAGAVVPALIGLAWGDPIGCLLVVGFLRLVYQWHATFCVNSLAHTIGQQPYGTKTSARDSFVTALVTMGEGYHNFHHVFPNDYRNGVRWYHLDPTKWAIWSLSKVCFTSGLKRTPPKRIQDARLQMKQAS